MKQTIMILVFSSITFISFSQDSLSANNNLADSVNKSIMFNYKQQQNQINSINFRMDVAGQHIKHGGNLVIGGAMIGVFGGMLAGIMSINASNNVAPIAIAGASGLASLITSFVGISHISKGGRQLSSKKILFIKKPKNNEHN